MALTNALGILAAITIATLNNSLNTYVLTWAAGIAAIAAATLIIEQRFLRSSDQKKQTDKDLNQLKFFILLSAIFWGAIPTQNLGDVIEASLQPYFQFSAIIVAIVAINGYGIYKHLFRYFLAALLLSLALNAFSNNTFTLLLIFAFIAPLLWISSKRYSEIVTNALIQRYKADQLLKQVVDSNEELAKSEAALSANLDVISQEEEVAKHIFHQLVLSSDNEIPGIKTWNQAMGSLSGDLIQVTSGPDQQSYVFLGDFTGHGLPAALGAVPASTVFRTMANKGLPVEVIARELNQKLFTLLPIGYFCCAAIVEISSDRTSMRIWNGGLPPVALQNSERRTLIELPSENLPLGVIGDEDFLDSCNELELHAKDRIYLYSDGLTEAENVDGEMWGKDRVLEFLSWHDFDESRMAELKMQILDFVNLAPPSDDVSIVEIEVTPSD